MTRNRFAMFRLDELRMLRDCLARGWPSATLAQLQHELSQALAEEEEESRLETEELIWPARNR